MVEIVMKLIVEVIFGDLYVVEILIDFNYWGINFLINGDGVGVFIEVVFWMIDLIVYWF